MTCCPFCETPIQADAPECPACLLTFPRICDLVGELPLLDPLVADTTGLLKGALPGIISESIQRLQQRFPQLVVQLVMHRFPAKHPFSTHAFWLFNAGAFAGEGKRGKDNHALLILIDPARQETAIIPGYGLEPLLKQEALDHLLEMSNPAFRASEWQVGLELLLDGLERLLETVSVADEGGEHAENDV